MDSGPVLHLYCKFFLWPKLWSLPKKEEQTEFPFGEVNSSVSQVEVRLRGVCVSFLLYIGLAVILAVFLDFIWRLQPRKLIWVQVMPQPRSGVLWPRVCGVWDWNLLGKDFALWGSIIQESAVHNETS